jgi:membrane fusion protein, multidrug efflux system
MKPLFQTALALLLAAALAVVIACGGRSQDEKGAPAGASLSPPPSGQPTEPPPLPADVADIAAADPGPAPSGAPGTIADRPAADPGTAGRVAATGELVSPVRSELAAKNPGRVRRVLVDEGDRVRRGQTLLEQETDYLALDLQRAEADVTRAKAAANEAERDFRRKEELIAKESIARAAYDRSQSAFESARAAVEGAVAARDLARQRLADAALRSPIDGVVAERRADPGERLGDNSVAFVVVQTAPLKLRFQLPERHLAALRQGLPVAATVDPYPGETFTGRVSTVGRVVDPQTRTVMVETEFPNRDGRLSPGLFARVEIDLSPALISGQSAAPPSERSGQ